MGRHRIAQMHLPLQEMMTGPAAEHGQQTVLEHGASLYAETITWAPGEGTFLTGFRLVNQVRLLLKEVKFCMK